MEASMVQIQRTSSIEREPRTLSMQQMQSARDLAIFIFNTKTFEEASTIFTQGLEPVVKAACDMRMMDGVDEREEAEMLKHAEAVVAAFRDDIASAPF